MIEPFPSPAGAPAAPGTCTSAALMPQLARPATIERADPFPELYVRTMLGLLPALMAVGTLVSGNLKQETNYLPDDFSFALTVQGTDLRCACRKDAQGHWHYLPKDDATIRSCTYTISFRDIDYAFLLFAGGATLKDALAGHYFSTQGPNNTGVALTYMFDIILRTFFFWRAAYRKEVQ